MRGRGWASPAGVIYSRGVILENGVVRTLDRSVPVARAVAVAGDRIAGAVGTPETAHASPEVVDLGGRVTGQLLGIVIHGVQIGARRGLRHHHPVVFAGGPACRRGRRWVDWKA